MAVTTSAVVGGVASAASSAASMSGGGGGMPKWQRKNAKNIAQEAKGVANGMNIAGFNPDQQVVQQGVRDSQGYLDADSAGAQDTARMLAQGVNPADIRAMYNPYEQDVVNSYLTDLDQIRGQNSLVTADLAEKQKAFGGDRAAVYDAVSNGELDRNAMSSIASLRHAGYDTAGRMALGNQGLRLAGNSQLQDIIDTRRGARYEDLSALNASGYAQQAQAQRQLDLPQDRLRFRSDMNGQPIQTGAPGGDQVGAALAGYQDGYTQINGLLQGWRTSAAPVASGSSKRTAGWNMYGDQG